MHTRMRTRMHAHAHAHTHTQSRAHVHAHTCTDTYGVVLAGAYATSEFARYTAAGAGGDLKSAPAVLAQRIQTKYRWQPPVTEQDTVRTIEAIELAILASGFGDPSGATPLLVVKSRQTFTKPE